ncbi:MAG: ADP-ribosylglycohydrolase family protein [Cyanobacteria bacterium P01_A01_bin.17]
MPYSLINRFGGALTGALVGEILPRPTPTEQPQERGDRDRVVSSLSFAIATSAQSLIATRSAPPLVTETNGAIASTIPIALYFHDNAQKLRQAIMNAIPQAIQDEGFVVAESIAAALKTQMVPFKLLPELVQLLPDETLSQKLRQVQILLTRRDSLAIAIQKLGDPQQIEVAVSLAFYCWLSTAEQFQLSVLRAHRIPNVSPLTLLLTGAFSGALNGRVGIPQAWLEAGASQNDLQRMEVSANQLLAAWSGCYQVEPDAVNGMDGVAIASPGILRPR